MIVGKLGQICYFDTVFSGMVRARVTGIFDDGREIRFRVIGKQGAYHAGVNYRANYTQVVPARAVRRRGSQLWIIPYRWYGAPETGGASSIDTQVRTLVWALPVSS